MFNQNNKKPKGMWNIINKLINKTATIQMKVKVRCIVNSSVVKIYILRLNLDQLRKMQIQGLWLGNEPAPSVSLDQRSTNWATEAVADSFDASSVYIYMCDNAGKVYTLAWLCKWIDCKKRIEYIL